MIGSQGDASATGAVLSPPLRSDEGTASLGGSSGSPVGAPPSTFAGVLPLKDAIQASMALSPPSATDAGTARFWLRVSRICSATMGVSKTTLSEGISPTAASLFINRTWAELYTMGEKGK